MASRLSIVVITKNEERNIVDCLEALSFADEIIVVDDQSTDRTVELSKMLKARIILRKLKNFSDQRNFALQTVKNEWVLFVDADEIVSTQLREEILSVIKENIADGYYLKRDDFMWGKRFLHGEARSIKIIRLGRKNSGKWTGKVHEKWKILGEIGSLQNPLIHAPHPTVSEFLGEIDGYTTLRAEELNEAGIRGGLIAVISYPIAKFFLNYFIRQGYRDGTGGTTHAIMMSMHSFLVRSKLFLLQNK